nr:MAG TPA: hypothetical protein [Caudoviricetes sp.]
MFKKGQLVQSVESGDYYVVAEVLYPEQEYARVSLTKNPSCLFMTRRQGLRLIGNNYRAKPKCLR